MTTTTNTNDATICFAGVNGTKLASGTEGYPVLVSFADAVTRPGVFEREILPRLRAGAYPFAILDSGAFTVISSGITIDVDAYGAFIAEHGELFDVVVNLDDIAGDVETTLANQRKLETYAPKGVAILPVFHQGEPLELLEAYCAEYGYIGLGFARTSPDENGKGGGRLAFPLAARREWLDTVFAIVPAGVKVHGFAMTRHVHEGYAFASVDSTTWINEKCGIQKRDPSAPHAVWGELGAAFDTMTHDELVRFVLDSWQLPTWNREHWTADAKGQGRTPLTRHGRDETLRRLGLARMAAA